MHSDRQLKNWYLKYNRRFWAEQLPENTILYWEPLSADAASACPVYEVDNGQFLIKLDPYVKGLGKFWKVNLLHEMVHVSLWIKHPKHQHGKLFKDEIKRIFLLGAYKDLL